MSGPTNDLTELQAEILDALANDFEDIQRIYEMIGSMATRGEVESALWRLVEKGLVACYAPGKTRMDLVHRPVRRLLDTYWFALSEEGERFLAALES